MTRPRLGYADLTPPQLLDALDAVGLRGDGRILQLNSYENRVHQVVLEDGRVVVTKFYRPGRWSDEQILEEHGFALELATAEVPVAPPLQLQAAPGALQLELRGRPPTLACLQRAGGHRFSVTARVPGREPEMDDPATMAQVGRFIGRLHAVGGCGRFDHRPTLDVRRDGEVALARLGNNPLLPADQRSAWLDAGASALAAAAAICDAWPPPRLLRLHGDCHRGNLLWHEGRVHIVDLDDACTGPPVQDLWMLAGDRPNADDPSFAALLAGYRQFAELSPRELAWIEPLRTLRMLRHSAWLAERWHDPAFPAAFPWFGTPAYWSQQITQLREQHVAMTS